MLLSLSNVPRDYAWGSSSLLAELEGRGPTGAPEAEVWFGDHPGDPADLADGSTLDAVTGGKLPYLLKLLAAADPLSIQVHPTIEQARDGWAREVALAADDPRRNYRDDNHKPELIVALSDRFEALSGLRPVADTLRLLAVLGESAGVAELRERLSGDGGVRDGDVADADVRDGGVRDGGVRDADMLRDALGWLLSGTAQAAVDDIIAAVAAVAEASSEFDAEFAAEFDAEFAAEFAAEFDAEFAAEFAAVRAIAERNPGDPGVVVALLMNFIVLRRGEGIFLRAGLLHAYVSGLGVEIMAASDNVLRGGLTPKHIDVPELLSVLDTAPLVVPVLRPAASEAVTSYEVDVPDFALRRVSLTQEPVSVSVSGPTMVLSTGGDVSVSGADAEALAVPVGSVAYATVDETTLLLTGTGEAFIAEPGR